MGDKQATEHDGDGFAALHRAGDPFVLPNAWDVASAALLAEAGFPAIGTTSLGIAAAHGLVDASRTGRAATRAVATELATARLEPYLTVDLEDGFSDDPEEVAALVAELAVDVVGVNLEDSTRGALVDPQRFARVITAVKRCNPTVFVNARTDVFWLGGTDLDEAITRLRYYTDAGADGIFVPGTADPRVIETITSTFAQPLNVLASAALSRAQFGELGVARISTGSLLYRSALTTALMTAEAVRDGLQFAPAIDYGRIQQLAE